MINCELRIRSICHKSVYIGLNRQRNIRSIGCYRNGSSGNIQCGECIRDNRSPGWTCGTCISCRPRISNRSCCPGRTLKTVWTARPRTAARGIVIWMTGGHTAWITAAVIVFIIVHNTFQYMGNIQILYLHSPISVAISLHNTGKIHLLPGIFMAIPPPACYGGRKKRRCPNLRASLYRINKSILQLETKVIFLFV